MFLLEALRVVETYALFMKPFIIKKFSEKILLDMANNLGWHPASHKICKDSCPLAFS